MNLDTIRFDFDRKSYDIFRKDMKKYDDFIMKHNIIYKSKPYHATDTWYYIYVIYELK